MTEVIQTDASFAIRYVQAVASIDAANDFGELTEVSSRRGYR